MWVLRRENSGDGCDLASSLCKYDLRKSNLLVLSLEMVRRVRQGSISDLYSAIGSALLLLTYPSCV